MTWTTARPLASGYYWAYVADALGNNGPIVLEIDVERGTVTDPSRYYCDVSEPNGDFIRSLEAYEQESFSVLAWSDEPVCPPAGKPEGAA